MRRVAFAILSTIAGLVGLLSFKTESLGTTASSSAVATLPSGTTTTPTPGSTSTASSTKTSGTSTGSTKSTKKTSTSAARSTTSAAAKSSSTAAATKTVTGSVIETQYGPVQVKITVTDGKVTAATVLQYPNGDPRSQQINAYAVPILQKETDGVSSANSVDAVSGATYTSDGYLQSLQSALDKAGL